MLLTDKDKVLVGGEVWRERNGDGHWYNGIGCYAVFKWEMLSKVFSYTETKKKKGTTTGGQEEPKG